MLDKICTSFEVSKKLKELGIETETNFCYSRLSHSPDENRYWFLQYWKSGFKGHDCYPDNFVAAYTLEQILEMLPNRIRLKSDEFPSHFFKYSLKIDIKESKIYYNCSSEVKYCINIDCNIATTAGKLLIKLKEDKII